MARKPKPSEPQAEVTEKVAPEDARKGEPKRTVHDGGIVSLDY
ncbi:hypothetical protein [Rhizobium leguminosarum]|jgi:hypothetical protein|nr:hypothetical protein [Rhizobium leguminosarum]WHO79754.1 hypothetical protein QMO81_002448 [Rhizobium leguminosarum]